MQQLRADFEEVLRPLSTWYLTHANPIPDSLVGLARAQAMCEDEYRSLLLAISSDAGHADTEAHGHLFEQIVGPLSMEAVDAPPVSDSTEDAALDWLDELLFTTWGSTVSLLDMPELQAIATGGEDAATQFERLCSEARLLIVLRWAMESTRVAPRADASLLCSKVS